MKYCNYDYAFMVDTLRGSVAEFFGLAIFVFIGGLGTQFSQLDSSGWYYQTSVPDMAHGLTIGLLIMSLGRVSGGHFNPAVTLAVFLAGKINWLKALFYVLCQLIGGFIGALFIWLVTDPFTYNTLVQGGITTPGIYVNWAEALVCECVLTYILVQTVLLTAVDTDGTNMLAPFAIGFAVAVDILAGAKISGASMNPARSLGPAMAFSILEQNVTSLYQNVTSLVIVVPDRERQWETMYLYWAGPFVGSVCAALVYKLLLGNSKNRWLLKTETHHEYTVTR